MSTRCLKASPVSEQPRVTPRQTSPEMCRMSLRNFIYIHCEAPGPVCANHVWHMKRKEIIFFPWCVKFAFLFLLASCISISWHYSNKNRLSPNFTSLTSVAPYIKEQEPQMLMEMPSLQQQAILVTWLNHTGVGEHCS